MCKQLLETKKKMSKLDREVSKRQLLQFPEKEAQTVL